MPLPKPALARVQMLARSSFYPDMLELLKDLREDALGDLLTANEPMRLYREQGKVAAVEYLAAFLSDLRVSPDVEGDAQQDNVTIPSAPAV